MPYSITSNPEFDLSSSTDTSLNDTPGGGGSFPAGQCVTYIRVKVNDYGPPQVVEDSFKAYSAFSQIHDHKFKTTFSPSGATTGWIPAAGGSITCPTSTSIEFTPPVGATPKGSVFSDSELPHSYLIRGNIQTCANSGLVVNLQSNDITALDNTHYWVGFNSVAEPVIYKYNKYTHVYDLVYQLPFAPADTGLLEIAVREQTFTADVDSLWLTISMTLNHKQIMTYIEWIKDSPVTPYFFGLGAMNGDPNTIDKLIIPQLTEFVEWNSLDPGEHPMDGLQRSIEGRYTKMFMRYNGTLFSWKAQSVSSSYTFTEDNIENLDRVLDKTQLVTHGRMIGAYKEAEYVRQDLGRHVYMQFNNPYLISDRECYNEVILSIQRQEELYDKTQLMASYRPLLEFGDRVTVIDTDYIIDSYHVSFNPAQAECQFSFRKYVFGA